MHIWDHVLQGKKLTEKCWHKAMYKRYTGLHLGILDMELKICNKAQENKERKDNQSDHFSDAVLRWIFEICSPGIRYKQLKPFLTQAKWREDFGLEKTASYNPHNFDSYLDLMILAWTICHYIDSPMWDIAQLIVCQTQQTLQASTLDNNHGSFLQLVTWIKTAWWRGWEGFL